MKHKSTRLYKLESKCAISMMFEWFKFVDCCRNYAEWKIVKWEIVEWENKGINTFVIKSVLRNQGRAVTNILEEKSEI
jgi:hypothetical protein